MPAPDAAEVEVVLAIVIGKAAHQVGEENALDLVAGYACYNDGSVRDWQRHTSQFTPGKNFPGTGAFGPFMVTADEVGDAQPQRLDPSEDRVEEARCLDIRACREQVSQARVQPEQALVQRAAGPVFRVQPALGLGARRHVLHFREEGQAALHGRPGRWGWRKAGRRRMDGCVVAGTGAHHVVYPEAAMGERVAHLVTGKMTDFMEFDDGFAIAKTGAPQESWGKTLSESALRSKYGVTVIAVKRTRADLTYATADTIVEPGDTLLVTGTAAIVERFAALT